jgi:hypothetical protein
MKHISFLSALVLMMFLVPTIGAMAEVPTKVILVSPSGRIEDGKTAKVEAHVFDAGVYKDPTTLSVYDYNYQKMTFTQRSTGIYNSTVIAKDGSLTANIQVGYNTSYSTLELRVDQKASPTSKTVTITPSKGTAMVVPKPGDKLDFYVRTYTGGALESDYTLYVQWNEVGKSGQSLPYSEVAEGIYSATFTVPQVTTSTSYTITASVYEDGWNRITASTQVYVDFAQVWFHKQILGPDSATFEIDVAEPTGKAIVGATVNLNCSYIQNGTYLEQYINAGTKVSDLNGKTTYTINYSKVMHTLTLYGTVETAGKVQQFYGDIIITPEPQEPSTPDGPRDPSAFGFDVVYQGDIGTIIKPAKTFTPTFRAYYGTYWPYSPSAPLATKEIVYYAYTYTEIVAYGKAVTDSTGNFTLTLAVPNIEDSVDYLNVDFSATMTGSMWYDHTETFTISKSGQTDYLSDPEKLRDKNVQVTVDKLTVGGTSKVTASYSGATVDSSAIVAWAPGSVGISDLMRLNDTQPEWSRLSQDGAFYMAKSGKDFVDGIYVPEFMPKGTYTVFVGCIVPESGSGEDAYSSYHVNYLHVKAGEGGTTGKGGITGMGTFAGLDVGILILLIVIIVIVLVVVAVVVIRRPRQPVMYQQVQAAPPPPQPAAVHPVPQVVQQAPVVIQPTTQVSAPQPVPSGQVVTIRDVVTTTQVQNEGQSPQYLKYDAPPPPPQ